MTSLLEEIRGISEVAARALEDAGCSTDSEIESLSRIDLNELLPGREYFKERKKVFEKIQNTKKKPTGVIQNEPKSHSLEPLRENFTDNGTAVECLNTLKEMKCHMNQMQMCIDKHIGLLERLTEKQDKELMKTPLEVNNQLVPLSSSSGASSQIGFQFGRPQQQTHVTVMHKTIITGKTLDAHLDVLKQVGKQFVQGEDSFQLQLEEKDDVEHCNIIIVFCPVVSRIGTDVESAMRQVPEGRDIILVLMHHSREAKTTSSLRTWSRPKHVVLDVNVFFHDAVGGLVTCKENDYAVSEIQRKLLNYSSNREKRPVSQTVSSRSNFGVSGWFPQIFSKSGN